MRALMRLNRFEKYFVMVKAQRLSESISAQLEPGSGYEYQSRGEILQDEQDAGIAGSVARTMRDALKDDLADPAKVDDLDNWFTALHPDEERDLDRRLPYWRVY